MGWIQHPGLRKAQSRFALRSTLARLIPHPLHETLFSSIMSVVVVVVVVRVLPCIATLIRPGLASGQISPQKHDRRPAVENAAKVSNGMRTRHNPGPCSCILPHHTHRPRRILANHRLQYA